MEFLFCIGIFFVFVGMILERKFAVLFFLSKAKSTISYCVAVR
jgi:hypothetical protein